jgi:hypothetical protein
MRRGRGLFLALVVVPLMLSVAYAAKVQALPLVDSIISVPAMAAGGGSEPLPPSAYVDPIERSVWIDGVKAVQQALGQPNYANFDDSFVNVTAGHVLTLCGDVSGTDGYGSASGAQRFISVFGQAQATTLEGTDASFSVLWNRVCTRDTNPIL